MLVPEDMDSPYFITNNNSNSNNNNITNSNNNNNNNSNTDISNDNNGHGNSGLVFNSAGQLDLISRSANITDSSPIVCTNLNNHHHHHHHHHHDLEQSSSSSSFNYDPFDGFSSFIDQQAAGVRLFDYLDVAGDCVSGAGNCDSGGGGCPDDDDDRAGSPASQIACSLDQLDQTFVHHHHIPSSLLLSSSSSSSPPPPGSLLNHHHNHHNHHHHHNHHNHHSHHHHQHNNHHQFGISNKLSGISNFHFQADPGQGDDNDLSETMTSFVADLNVDSDAGYNSGVDLFSSSAIIDCTDSTEAFYLRLALEQNNNNNSTNYMNNNNNTSCNFGSLTSISNSNSTSNNINSSSSSSSNNINCNSNASQLANRSVLMNLLIDGSDVGAGYTIHNCRAQSDRSSTVAPAVQLQHRQ